MNMCIYIHILTYMYIYISVHTYIGICLDTRCSYVVWSQWSQLRITWVALKMMCKYIYIYIYVY